MIKLVKDLTDDEILDYLGDNECDYCPFSEVEDIHGNVYTCPRQVVCYGDDPIYPACMEDEQVHREIAREYRKNYGYERI